MGGSRGGGGGGAGFYLAIKDQKFVIILTHSKKPELYNFASGSIAGIVVRQTINETVSVIFGENHHFDSMVVC